jgi:hypothetical protein
MNAQTAKDFAAIGTSSIFLKSFLQICATPIEKTA